MIHKSSDNSMTNSNVKSSLLREIYPFVSGSQPEAEQQVCVCVRERNSENIGAKYSNEVKTYCKNGFGAMSQYEALRQLTQQMNRS